MTLVKPAITPTAGAKGTPQAPVPHRNLPLLLLLAREGVIGLFRPLLHAQGLTEQQWRVLRVLVEFGALEPRQIGRLCGLSSPSLAGILARMQEQGLITRQALAHDKRRQAVSATARSRRTAARLAPEIEAVYRRLEEALGPAVVDRLYATLDELVAALGDQPAGEGAEDSAGDSAG
jgi:homoprotocatechuate degradation regulator HpaR